MILTKGHISIIINDFEEKGRNANKILKEHPTFHFSRIAVYNLIKKVKKTASDEQRKRSCRTVSGTVE